MGILTQQNKKKSKTKRQTPEMHFNEALARYQRFKKEDAKLEQEMHELIARVRLQVDEYEIAKHQQVYLLTQKLIPFFSKKTLSEYLREELFQWIDHNMCMLAFGPYAEHFDMDVLENLLHEHTNQHVQNRQEKELKKLAKEGVDEQVISELREMADRARQAESPEALEELMRSALEEAMEDSDDFEETAQPEDSLFEGLFDDEEELAGNDFGDGGEFAQQQADQHKALDRLFKDSSINKLFRRITKKWHPDLEPDEQKKAKRHQQMCELIEARDNKDIAYILQAYQETFGTMPDNFPEQDYVNLTQVLKAMTEQLSENSGEVLEQIPYGHAYYDLFYRKNKQYEAAAIDNHIQQLKQLKNDYQRMCADITSIPSLKRCLEERMYGMPELASNDDEEHFLW